MPWASGPLGGTSERESETTLPTRGTCERLPAMRPQATRRRLGGSLAMTVRQPQRIVVKLQTIAPAPPKPVVPRAVAASRATQIRLRSTGLAAPR